MRLARLPRYPAIAAAAAACLLAALLSSHSANFTFGGSGGARPALTAQETAVILRAAQAARKEAAALRAAGTGPTCAPPPMPSATYPEPGGGVGYGIPFVAAIYNVNLLSGYSEYIANNSVITAGTQTYDQSPWLSSVHNLTGWTAGVLQLPGLKGQVASSGIKFCANLDPNCLSATPPAGTCLGISLANPVGPGSQPEPPSANTTMQPVVASGPSSLAPGQSAVYNLTVPTGHYNFGITVDFTGSSGSQAVSGAAAAFYSGPPYDAFPNQELKLSNVTVNGQPADTAPGPVLAPGSTYTVKATVTEEATVALGGGQVWTSNGGATTASLFPKPNQAVPISFTGTVPAGSNAIMMFASATTSGGTLVNYSAFSPIYIQGYNSSPGAGLVVTNPVINGASAATSPGPEVTGPTYSLAVTVTNESKSTITGITGTTPSAPCSQSLYCTPYIGAVNPGGTATLSVTGVEPDGALDVAGTASSTAELGEFLGTTLYTVQQQAPTVVSISSQQQALPSSAPPPPEAGNADQRGLQVPPAPVTGPLVGGTGTVVSDDFAVPAFVPVDTSGIKQIVEQSLSNLFNSYAAGFKPESLTAGSFYVPGSPIAAQPGWAQFAATAQITQLGIPSGLPQNLDFGNL